MLTRREIEERLERFTALGAMSKEAHALETAQQLYAENADLRNLAADLAEMDPAGTMNCPYCKGRWYTANDMSWFRHADDCLWQRAQRWKRCRS